MLLSELAMHKSNLGATCRLFFGAALIMFDFVTDVLMIRDYFQQSERPGTEGVGTVWYAARELGFQLVD